MQSGLTKASLHVLKQKVQRDAGLAGLPLKTYRKLHFLSALTSHLAEICKRRCRRTGVEFALPSGYIRNLWIEQDGVCALTGVRMEYQPQGPGNFAMKNPVAPTVDRVAADAGYVPGNVRLVCFWANNARYSFGDEVFYKMCKRAARK